LIYPDYQLPEDKASSYSHGHHFMKTLLFRIVQVVLISACSSSLMAAKPKHEPRHFVVFCSPGLTKPQKEQVLIEFQKFVAGGGGQKAAEDKGMIPGDTISVFDAATLKQIAPELCIPASARTGSLQLNSAQASVAAFRDFLKKSDGTNAVVNLPALVGSWHEKIPYTDATVLLIGSPLYHDDVDARDMRKGWPSDGFFKQAHDTSVFSTLDRKEALKDGRVYYCIGDDDVWGTPSKQSHREMIRRFWSLYLNQCGGHLQSFQADIPTAFKGLLRTDLQDIVAQDSLRVDESDKTVELRTARINLTATNETTTTVGQHSNLLTNSSDPAQPSPTPFPAPTATPTPTPDPTPAPQLDLSSVEWSWLTTDDAVAYREKHPGPKSLPPIGMCLVGLRWNTDQNPPGSDLDLHVKMKGAPQELFWGRQQTPEGQHFKDFSNPDAKNGFEIVILNVPVNPKDLDVWVNTYKGTSEKGFSGEVRVLYSGHLMSYPFLVPGKHGTKGDVSPSREQDRAWVKIPTEIPN
jgi:hypothetical protein